MTKVTVIKSIKPDHSYFLTAKVQKKVGRKARWGGGGVLPYLSDIGLRRFEGYGFLAV